MFERDGVVTMTEKRPTPKHNGNLTLGLCAKVVGGRGERVTRQPGEGPMTGDCPCSRDCSASTSIASPANCASSSREINEELLSIEQFNSSTPVPVKGLGDQVIDSIISIDVSRSVDIPTSCSRSNSSNQLCLSIRRRVEGGEWDCEAGRVSAGGAGGADSSKLGTGGARLPSTSYLALSVGGSALHIWPSAVSRSLFCRVGGRSGRCSLQNA